MIRNIPLLGPQEAPAADKFPDLASFQAAGGAAAYGDGPVWIGGEQHVVVNGELNPQPEQQRKRLWPVNGLNRVIRGSDDYNGVCTYLYDRAGRRYLASDLLTFTTFDMATLLDSAGNALGASVTVMAVKAVSPDVILMEAQNTATLKCYVFRSINKGVNWGNNALGDNLRPVLEVGHDGTTHGSNVQLLFGEALQSVVINGQRVVLAAWYNIQQGNAYQLNKIHASYDDGLTWTTIASTNALTKHFHLIKQDPYTGHIWFGCGDYGQQMCMFSWDGVSPFPSGNFTQADLASSNGFVVLNGSAEFRPLAFWFTEDYVYWSVDNSDVVSDQYRGIFRSLKTRNTSEKVSDINTTLAKTAGGPGIVTKSGLWLNVDFPEPAETETTKWVYASTDQGKTWYRIGNVQLRADVNSYRNLLMGNCGDLVWISHENIAGRGPMQTYFYRVVDGYIDEADNIAPVVWVDKHAANAADAQSTVPAIDNMLNGNRPEYPFLSVNYPLSVSSNKITYGHRVIVRKGEYVSGNINLNWSLTPAPGTVGKPVQVTRDIDQRFEMRATTGVGIFLNATQADHGFVIEDADLSTVDVGTRVFGGTNVQTGRAVFRKCVVNPRKQNNTGDMMQSRGMELILDRSVIYGGSSTACVRVYQDGAAIPPKIINSAIIGGANGVVSELSGSQTFGAIIENSVIANQTTASISNTSSPGKRFSVRNSFLRSTGNPVRHTNAVNYSNEIDYSVISGSNLNANGVINTNGIAYSAEMWQMLATGDFSPNSLAVLTGGAKKAVGGATDINGNVADNYIGCVGK